ncbi:CynX/NimT family MFS transporter [Edaphobacillus lindanitolerans]|uniref:MFS transporter, CP family, cyanate transporter n=1 Tax=Edaphobacillus lindanitolerans TaxID=550447 RepID=A0A1U7PKM5_9BACI|nr:MFS transporter [Edaphobacillus lindanitolerans]SIT85553.1 MFS transporter, CP family, cyanate transporter [Edaphobacillus lindanitolerans]
MEDTHTYRSKRLNLPPGAWLLLLGVIAIAFTLRSPLTSVGPVISKIMGDLGISNTTAGFLTTIPLLAFALVSPVVPKIADRIGMARSLFLALLILIIGVLIRSSGGTGMLISGTFLLGVAISFGNVLLPSLVKLNFPMQVGLMTGVYTVSMNLAAGVAAGLSTPISNSVALGWRASLGVWALFGVIGAIIWLPQVKKRPVLEVAGMAKGPAPRPLWKSPLAWGVTFFMGFQSVMFYTTAAWVPEVLTSRGMDDSTAGWMFSLVQFSQIPFTFLIPIIAGRLKDQRLLVVIIAAFYLTGYGGLFVDNLALTPLWMVLMGVSGGASFGLAMMFFALRTNTPSEAASLSGMAQSLGYLLAAAGPVLFGAFHDMTGAWNASIWLFIITIILLLLAGLKAGKDEKTVPETGQ